MVNKFLLSVFYTGITSFSVIVTNLQLFDKMSKLFSTFFSTRAFLGKLFLNAAGAAQYSTAPMALSTTMPRAS